MAKIHAESAISRSLRGLLMPSPVSGYRPYRGNMSQSRIPGTRVIGASIDWYTRSMPGQFFTSVYDDAALQGWWPWPKEGASSVADPYTGKHCWDDDLYRSYPSIPAGSKPRHAASVSRHHQQHPKAAPSCRWGWGK
ncbi:hypothetical protein N657DRAFT_313942 [Parathielavia appendiculata]|uniref:Uncharacterized protein n=1 Tax=Parathielavia appendiculata TaxID=2587402 RepID=A0AAN6Z688_9PEZI|nr:hypothetical protein N657DRAFT_313942 [Parathielavia appendiculata]